MRAMAKSVEYWVQAKYRAAHASNVVAGIITTDSTPFEDQRALFRELSKLRARWEKYFGSIAEVISAKFVDAAYTANKLAWQAQTKREGFDVPLQLTAAQRSVLSASVANNVSLIKSISTEYFTKVEGDVARGFLAGRDLESTAASLRALGQVTDNRAALIARDQSNKLNAHLNSARQNELGIRYAYWRHSSAGKDPRHTHVRAGREKWIYDTQVGIDFGDQFGSSLPGTPINCRCGSRSIIPAIDGELGPDDLVPVPGFPGAYTKRNK
ncbi:minor capsid protein [Xanthomonas phage XPV2]|nr:minor capsid protein [Xanthomonas phage XPV2]